MIVATRTDLFDAAGTAATLAAVRDRRPLVLSLTNTVVANLTANMLLAIGASPVMLEDEGEAVELAARADALVINLGTLNNASARAMEGAANTARHAGRPWVLDPVGAGVLGFRTAFAQRLLALRPTAIKGNASEIAALAGAGTSGHGVDSVAQPHEALGPARRLATLTGAIVAVTGPVDLVTDGARVVEVRNGHPLMGRITGMGCSAAALMSACLAVTEDSRPARLAALAHALVLLEVSAELAVARGISGPASLQAGLIDALSTLDEGAILASARFGLSPRLGLDPTLCLVADSAIIKGRTLAELVAAAVAGGATMVQLRDKRDDARRFVEDARHLHELLVPLGIPLVINDRVDIAAAVGAEGIHLGQSDLPPADARRILGDGAIIGMSVTNEAEAADADPAIVDYLGVGPVFATATKSDAAAPLGAAGVAAIRARAPSLPLMAIGGLNAETLPALPDTVPIDGIAVVSALCTASDPQAVAAQLRALAEGRRRAT